MFLKNNSNSFPSHTHKFRTDWRVTKWILRLKI